MTLHALALASECSYPHLHRHVKHKAPVGLDVARKLEAWSRAEVTAGRLKAWISAADVLGLSSAPPEAPEAPIDGCTPAELP